MGNSIGQLAARRTFIEGDLVSFKGKNWYYVEAKGFDEAVLRDLETRVDEAVIFSKDNRIRFADGFTPGMTLNLMLQ